MNLLKVLAPGLDVHDGGLNVFLGAQYAEKIEWLRYLLCNRKQALKVRSASLTCEALELLPNVGYHRGRTDEAAHETGLKKYGTLQSVSFHPVYLFEAQGAFRVSRE